MTSNASELDLYGIWGNRSVTITQISRVAQLTFDFDERPHTLCIVNPSSFAESVKFLDAECCHIAVFNRNVEESNCLEFGMYRIELGDEDGPIGMLQADQVSLEVG